MESGVSFMGQNFSDGVLGLTGLLQPTMYWANEREGGCFTDSGIRIKHKPHFGLYLSIP